MLSSLAVAWSVTEGAAFSLLVACACAGEFKALSALLEEKEPGRIDAPNEDGHTALFLASKLGHIECVRLLLAKQANPSVSDSDGTPAVTHFLCDMRE